MPSRRMRDAEIRARIHAELDALGVPWVDEIHLRREPRAAPEDEAVRIDMVALVGGVLTAIEIKSGSDSLERLERQQRVALRRFRQVVVVAEDRHVADVRDAIDPRCGIWVCVPQEHGFHLVMRSRSAGARRPRPRARAHTARLVSLLRKAEIAAALGASPEGATKGAFAQRLAERPVEEVERAVLHAWRQRKLTGENPKPHLASR